MRFVATAVVLLLACQQRDDKTITSVPSGSAAPVKSDLPAGTPEVEQIKPPIDVTHPPLDAVTTKSGLIFKKLASVEGGELAKRNDTVTLAYTGWRQVNGRTFFTNRGMRPMPLPLATTAPGFREAIQMMRKGELAMLWLPPAIAYKDGPPPGSAPETLVYEVEVVDHLIAPPVPPDLEGPPETAQSLKSGIKYVVVRPGKTNDKIRFYDTVTFNYSAWDRDGRMFDSTELRKRPAIVPPYRQSTAMEEMLVSMSVGQRVRFWVPSERMQLAGKPVAGMPPGTLVYELDMLSVAKGKEPPKLPPDVSEPPATATKTARGVFYRVLKPGKGPKPSTEDTVRVHYTGWTTDGRMFDSSVVKGESAEFSLRGVIVGWSDGIPLMSVGERTRFWIPDELAYKGAPGKPQGMLVFDVELLEIKPGAVEQDHGLGDTFDGTGKLPEAVPPPPDVAAPPAGAMKSPRGVFYKVFEPVEIDPTR